MYYRVYAPNGALSCKKPLPGNPFIGRIKATSVPPPHTVASLKRALVQAEALPDPSGDLTSLFQTKDARAAMASTARVDILGGDIGATSQTAVALVFLSSPKLWFLFQPAGEEDEVGELHYRESVFDGLVSNVSAFLTFYFRLGSGG